MWRAASEMRKHSPKQYPPGRQWRSGIPRRKVSGYRQPAGGAVPPSQASVTMGFGWCRGRIEFTRIPCAASCRLETELTRAADARTHRRRQTPRAHAALEATVTRERLFVRSLSCWSIMMRANSREAQEHAIGVDRVQALPGVAGSRSGWLWAMPAASTAPVMGSSSAATALARAYRPHQTSGRGSEDSVPVGTEGGNGLLRKASSKYRINRS